MKATINWESKTRAIEFDGSEGDLFRQAGTVLLECSIPCKLEIITEAGSARYDVGERGTYKKNGADVPSMLVSEEHFDIEGLSPSVYEKSFLTCINLEGNNYKFYELRQETDGVWARYGRIGCARGEMFGEREIRSPYPSRQFWLKYYEKLAKGYVDVTDTRQGPLAKDAKRKQAPRASEGDENPTRSGLYNFLYAFAHNLVRNTFVSEDATMAQVRAAKAALYEMGRRKTVKGFNSQLSKLLAVSPRKARHLQDVIAKSERDFDAIIQRESDLIAAMEGVAGSADAGAVGRFAADVSVAEANEDERKIVEACLSNRLKGMLRRVWVVTVPWQAKRFDDHLSENGITNTKLLWHGSRNSNWMSIVQNGLIITPSPEHGRMYGDGIYASGFGEAGTSGSSEAAEKSFNYTSYRGSYWSRGRDDVALMGLYEAAYGNPLVVNGCGRYTKEQLKRLGFDCVHARSGVALRHDEIVFYEESCLCLRYLCEFR